MKAILLLLATLAIPAAGSAQDDDRLRMYRIAVVMFQGRQTDAALHLAESWKPDAIRRDARLLIDDRDARLAPGVALVLTEQARRDTKASGPERIAAADLLVNSLRRNSAEIRAFQERWFAFMSSAFIAELNPSPARELLNRGLRVVGESARLQMLSGIAYEMSTYPHAVCPATDCRLSDERRARVLTLAAAAYRQVTDQNKEPETLVTIRTVCRNRSREQIFHRHFRRGADCRAVAHP